jgi:hypothetical protein
VLQIRTPLTVFCGMLNSKGRVLHTVGEMCRIFSESLVSTCISSLPFIRLHVRCLFRPLAVASSALRRHYRKRGEELKSHGSYVASSFEECDAILWITVLHVWQERRQHAWTCRSSAAEPFNAIDTQQQRVPSGARQQNVRVFWRRMMALLKRKAAAALSALPTEDSRRDVCDAVCQSKSSLRNVR